VISISRPNFAVEERNTEERDGLSKSRLTLYSVSDIHLQILYQYAGFFDPSHK